MWINLIHLDCGFNPCGLINPVWIVDLIQDEFNPVELNQRYVRIDEFTQLSSQHQPAVQEEHRVN